MADLPEPGLASCQGRPSPVQALTSSPGSFLQPWGTGTTPSAQLLPQEWGGQAALGGAGRAPWLPVNT